MSVGFAHLFSPIEVGPVTLKNRIALAPHGPMYSTEGIIGQRYVDYEVERAKGGAGLIIMSYGLSDPEAPGMGGVPWNGLIAAWRKENIPFFREVIAGAYEHDCRVFFQFGESTFRTGFAPTGMPSPIPGGPPTRDMSVADIGRMMDNYARVAENLAEAGFDGIEMHGHGDHLNDFLSPVANQRTDDYGGSSENRARYFIEAAAVIRAAIGSGMALGARLSVDGQMPSVLRLGEGIDMARLLTEGGRLDYLNVDTTYIAPMYVEPGHQLYASGAVKAALGDLPIFTVGRITTPELAERAIAERQADVVTMARALIADPELPNKAREGRGEDIRPCLGDNQECIARVHRGQPMACTVNPAAGHEGTWGIGRIDPAARGRKVMIVGGGPAGMEAARVAASRGHQVVLYEKSAALGGNVTLAQRLPGRADIGRFIPWHVRQLEKLGVTVRLGVEVTREIVAGEAPDSVVLATGAAWLTSAHDYPAVQTAPGAAGRALSLIEVVSGRSDPGRRVVVYDLKGFTEAPGVAELLAAAGRQVEIVTPLPKLGTADLDLTGQTAYIAARLQAANVPVIVDMRLAAIEDGSVTLVHVHTGETQSRAADDVVIVADRRSDDVLAQELAGLDIEVHRIGDCAEPGNVGQAFRQGFEVAVGL